MRVLHVVKTSDGASWAASQAAVLVRSGVEVHVALPRAEGRTVEAWRRAGAAIHIADLSLPVRHPGQFGIVARGARRLVAEVQPDLIHSHFVTTTLTLRLALGKRHKVPRVYQVAGPLHLEHWPSRLADLLTAGQPDYWVASSRCIQRHYEQARVPSSRLFLSYYGTDIMVGQRRGFLREQLGIPEDAFVVGNINYIYPPKYYLGQRVGLKRHEDVIDALAIVMAKLKNVYGALIGNTLPGYPASYEKALRNRARNAGEGRILMPGHFSTEQVRESWADFDCVVHVPSSENCGGVVEPLFAGLPVIASNVGGLPEVVLDGVTGKLVPVANPAALASAIVSVLSNLGYWRTLAANGRALVQAMFDVNRTGIEILQIYRHILSGVSRPSDFTADFLEVAPSRQLTLA